MEEAAFLRGDGNAELVALFDDGSSVIWLQFTGFLDEAGTEIYEGHVVEYEWLWSSESEKPVRDVVRDIRKDYIWLSALSTTSALE